MFTPPTPRSFYFMVVLLASLATANLGKAQQVKLFPLANYEATLRQYHTQKVKVACTEFEARTKMKWWYYLPTIGYNFGLPSINGGTSQLVNIDQTRQQNRVKLAAIISQGLLDYRTELHQLRSMYTAVQIERDAVAELNTSWLTEESIFLIAKEAHKKQEIKPIDYYQASLTYQREYSAHEAREHAYAYKVIELARFARFEFPEETLPEVDSLYTK